MFRRVAVLILLLPALAHAQSYLVGYAGLFSRVQFQRLELFGFQSHPESTTTTAVGFGGGTVIWRVQVDGSLLYTKTGETDVFVGFTREVKQTATGSALLAEAGAGWRLFKLAGFQVAARAGYGTSQVRVPTQIPIDENRRFWTYGFAANRPFGSRFLIQIDARNLQFRGEDIPQTLGRHNVAVLAGLGVKF